MERIGPEGGARKSLGLIHMWAAFIKVSLYILIPTLGGIIIGIRLDVPGSFLWTILLMLAGLVLGSILAWFTTQIEMRHQAHHKG